MLDFKFDLQRFAGIPNTLTFDSYSNKWIHTHRAIDMPGLSNNGQGDNANQMAITTTNVSIYSNGMKLGFVQSFTPSESRDITPIQELGTEGVVQMVPGNTRGGQIQLQRVALYNSDIWNAMGLTATGQFINQDSVIESGNAAGNNFISGSAFKRMDSGTYGNPFRTLKDQRVPLEIWVETLLPYDTTTGSDIQNYNVLLEIYFDCWVSSYQKTIQASQVWISESMTLEYSDMDSQIMQRIFGSSSQSVDGYSAAASAGYVE